MKNQPTTRQLNLTKRLNEIKINTIGNTEARKQHKEANKSLIIAKEIDKQKVIDGYLWMFKGSIKKLVHPDNVITQLNNGFKTSKSY